MKFAIVGGGFTGCMAAIHALENGHEVHLFERERHLGGVLKDVDISGERFLNGCHYLSYELVIRFLPGSELIGFKHEYGSFTRFQASEGQPTDDFAQPVFSVRVPACLCQSPNIFGTALQRLKAYGKVSERLITWAERFGRLEDLDWRCLIPMQLSRVYFSADDKLHTLKATSEIADSLLGIPRSKRIPAVSAETVFLPIEGYDRLFFDLECKLKGLGCRLNLDSAIKLVVRKGRPAVYKKGIEESFDYVIWTANPNPLFAKFFGGVLSTPPIRMSLIVGEFHGLNESKLLSVPYYWQIFDSESRVTRMFIYKLNGRLKFAAELFGCTDSQELLYSLRLTIGRLGLPTNYTAIPPVAQKRYVNFTCDEASLIQGYTSRLGEHNIILSNLLTYGRESKVRDLIAAIDKVARKEH